VALRYSTDLGVLDRLKNDLAFRVRRKIFDIFMRECRPSPESRIADLGVSGHRDHPTHYFFETLYPWKERITAVGRVGEDARWFPQAFPGLTFLEADLREIPLPDDHFDAGLCNAVVEHAGPRAEQAALVREVCRVARQVVFTTPNKAFPVELHTFLPLLHWLPDARYRALLRKLGQSYFAEVSNLNLLDRRSFLGLFPRERDNRLLVTGAPLLPTNLIVVSRKPDTAGADGHEAARAGASSRPIR
jgi:methyltransferase family protein